RRRAGRAASSRRAGPGGRSPVPPAARESGTPRLLLALTVTRTPPSLWPGGPGCGTQSRRLITRRSQFQILPPLLRKAPETAPFLFDEGSNYYFCRCFSKARPGGRTRARARTPPPRGRALARLGVL